MVVLLYGYYTKTNLGDDLFELIFTKYFENKNKTIVTMNPHDLNVSYKSNLNIDFILFGGGEIINSYFLFPIFKYMKYHNNYNILIHGISIGYQRKSNKLVDFFDKCIFRNNIEIVDNDRYFFSNDIVFNIKDYLSYEVNCVPHTIGYYLIDTIPVEIYDMIKNVTNNIKDNYRINFILFDKSKDCEIVSKLISDCKLINFSIVIRSNSIELVKELLKNEKHLCMRFHAHVLCYLYKVNFISIPLTPKAKEFNRLYEIPWSNTSEDILELLESQNIVFKDVNFNMDLMDNIIFSDSEITPVNKKESTWKIYLDIYEVLVKIIQNKHTITDIDNRIKYLCDMIELNILGSLDTKYRYGLVEKISNLIDKHTIANFNLQVKFSSVITDIVE